jgi:3',5'-cyclic AMP phosphodiesterase CpdA
MIHHPPVRAAVSQHKRLFGIRRFQKIVARHGAELVLHGHSHEPSLYSIASGAGRIPVVGVAAAGQSPGGSHPAAQYNLIDIGGEAGNWQISLTRRGLTGPSIPPADLETIDLTTVPDTRRRLVKT